MKRPATATEKYLSRKAIILRDTVTCCAQQLAAAKVFVSRLERECLLVPLTLSQQQRYAENIAIISSRQKTLRFAVPAFEDHTKLCHRLWKTGAQIDTRTWTITEN